LDTKEKGNDMNTKTTVAVIIVAGIAGGAMFRALAEDKEEPVIPRERLRTFQKTFQMDVETDDRWAPSLTAAQREEAARTAIVGWCKAFAASDLDEIVKLSGVPFWMDGNLLDSEAAVRADFKQQLGFEYKPTEFIVEKDFSQVVKELDFPMNGMLFRVSDGTRRMGFTVQFGKSVVVVAVD